MLVTLTFNVYDDEFDVTNEMVDVYDIKDIKMAVEAAPLHFGVSAEDVTLVQIAPYVEADDPYAGLDDYEVPF